MSKLVTDVKQYAKLLNSVGPRGRGPGRKRPLQPLECARMIKRLIDEEGESLDKIAERLNLGKPSTNSNMYKKRNTTQVSVLLSLLNVSSKSRELAGWNTDGYPRIPFSTMAQLSTMKEEDQDLIIQSIYNTRKKRRTLSEKDVRKIKKWRNENPDLPIKECIENVQQLKPVKVITHMIVIEIQGELQKFIESNVDHVEKILEMLREKFPGKFYEISIGNSVVAISMDEEAYETFYKEQYEKKSSYAIFLNDFLADQIG